MAISRLRMCQASSLFLFLEVQWKAVINLTLLISVTFPPTANSALFFVVLLLPDYGDLIGMSLFYRNFWPPSSSTILLLHYTLATLAYFELLEHAKLTPTSGPAQLLLLLLEYSSSTMSCGGPFFSIWASSHSVPFHDEPPCWAALLVTLYHSALFTFYFLYPLTKSDDP